MTGAGGPEWGEGPAGVPKPDAATVAHASNDAASLDPAPGPEPVPEPPAAPAAVAAPRLLPPPPPAFGPPPPPRFGVPGAYGTFTAPAPAPQPAPPTAEALAIPLGPRRLVGMSLDLLTRNDSGLRAASFYIGFVLLLTVGPAVALLGIAIATGNGDAFGGSTSSSSRDAGDQTWALWLLLAMVPAILGFIAVSVEAKALATAVIGGRAEGRPLRLRESIAVTRARFWSVLGAGFLVGLLSYGVQVVLTLVLSVIFKKAEAVSALDYIVSVAVGVVIGTPFIYAPAGIILGEAGATEALRRSIRLARARKQLAVVVTLFSVLAGLVVQFGLGIALDTVSRVLSGTGLVDHFPAALVVPLAAALVFAYGTLVLLTEAIAAAPAVHAFVALTHYSGGLERGRREPLPVRHVWDPWMTRGLAVATGVAVVSLLFGLLAIPWNGPS